MPDPQVTEEQASLPDGFGWRTPSPLPNRWINNGFEGWDGPARIDWPERGASLQIDADPILSRDIIVCPDTARDEAHVGDRICSEPMTHSVDGWRMDGMVRLAVVGR